MGSATATVPHQIEATLLDAGFPHVADHEGFNVVAGSYIVKVFWVLAPSQRRRAVVAEMIEVLEHAGFSVDYSEDCATCCASVLNLPPRRICDHHRN